MERRVFLKKLVVTAAVAAAIGGTPSVYAKDTVKVGILHSLSGTMAISETALKDVALMTIEEINAKGGVMGYQIEPVVVDPASNWPLFAEKARQLLSQDKVAVVFGCRGGEQGHGPSFAERPAMGAVAERLADQVIVTEDNPRFEDGERIVAQILAGMAHPQRAMVERQRALAIRAALACAGRQDAVLVAGKGSETVQDMGKLKVQFSDRAQVVQALNEWEGRL